VVVDWMINVAHSYPLGAQFVHYIPSERAQLLHDAMGLDTLRRVIV